MVYVDRCGLPAAVLCTSASPHEVRLVEQTIAARFTWGKPERLVGDLAYDSDPLDAALRKKRHSTCCTAQSQP